MRPIEFAAVGRGPGSQPSESDGAALAYPSMPKGMATYRTPILPEQDSVAGLEPALSRLREIQGLVYGYGVGSEPAVLDLSDLDAASRRLVDEVLGEGEVSIRCAGSPIVEIQETRLAGVWRVRCLGRGGGVERGWIEVADIPAVVRSETFRRACGSVPPDPDVPEGVLNAPPLLTELSDRAERWAEGREPHVVNLTLLPQSEQDLAFLEDRLGTGPVTILSRGYGNCRIGATRLKHVWWVRHYNSEDRLILNTLEVVDVPVAALAAQEDLDDSAARLSEILEALQ